MRKVGWNDSHVPNSQKAVQTRRSAPSSEALILDFHIAHEKEGVPGSGSMLLPLSRSSTSHGIGQKRVTLHVRVHVLLR